MIKFKIIVELYIFKFLYKLYLTELIKTNLQANQIKFQDETITHIVLPKISVEILKDKDKRYIFKYIYI